MRVHYIKTVSPFLHVVGGGCRDCACNFALCGHHLIRPVLVDSH